MLMNTLEILYEDNHIIVCIKPRGIATQSKRIGQPDMVSLLKNHIHKAARAKGDPYLAVIHRLDQPVTGILVFAKTPFAAREPAAHPPGLWQILPHPCRWPPAEDGRYPGALYH